MKQAINGPHWRRQRRWALIMLVAAVLVIGVLPVFDAWYDKYDGPNAKNGAGHFRPDAYVSSAPPSLSGGMAFFVMRRSYPSPGHDQITGYIIGGPDPRMFYVPLLDQRPPSGAVDIFGQTLDDMKTEFYADLGWDDPNWSDQSRRNIQRQRAAMK